MGIAIKVVESTVYTLITKGVYCIDGTFFLPLYRIQTTLLRGKINFCPKFKEHFGSTAVYFASGEHSGPVNYTEKSANVWKFSCFPFSTLLIHW